jgi:hypothetical protein
MDELNKEVHPNLQIRIPVGTVTSRLRQFQAVSDQACLSSNDTDFAEGNHERTYLGERHGPWRRFADSTTHLLDVPDFRMPPAAQLFVFHNCGRKGGNEEFTSTARQPGARSTLRIQPSCRKSFSMGHLCDKFGLTEIQSPGGRHADAEGTRFNPIHMPSKTDNSATLFANPQKSLSKSEYLQMNSSASYTTPKVEKWRSAQDMFTQYNIDKPVGWLSDVEALSLSGDGNASPRSFCRYCHVCSTATWAPTFCSSCGHRLCQKCVCEVPGGTAQAHANFSHHPSPAMEGPQYLFTTKSDVGSTQTVHRERLRRRSASKSREENHLGPAKPQPPTVRADCSWRVTDDNDSESRSPEIFECRKTQTTWSAWDNPLHEDKREKKLEQASLNTGTRNECDDPMCRATHTGHYPYRHSVSCSKHGSEQSRKLTDRVSASHQHETSHTDMPEKKSESDVNAPLPEGDTVHRHHSARFHSHHHIVEHLSSAVSHRAYQHMGENNNKKGSRTVSSKTSIEPLAKAQPTSQIASFQWTQDSVPQGHPRRPEVYVRTEGQPEHSGNRATPSALDYRSQDAEVTEGTYEAGKVAVEGKKRQTRDDSSLSFGDHDTPRRRLASTPPWLKEPTKHAADATSRLHHVNSKGQEAHAQEHDFNWEASASNWKRHQTARSGNAHAGKHPSSLHHSRSSHELIRASAPSPPIALHVTQHQDTPGWLNPHDQHHIQSRDDKEKP